MRNETCIGVLAVAVLLVICAATLLLLPGCSSCDSTASYRMPDGTICDYVGWMNGGAHFYACENGREYLNPPYWSEVQRKACK